MNAMNIFHIKTNGFCDFLRFSIHFPFGRHFSMNLHKEKIIFTTATTTHTEFFPLLATTESARLPQMRTFSLQFFEK